MISRIVPAFVLAIAWLGLLAPAPARAQAGYGDAAEEEDPQLTRLLGAGWAFLEASALSKAEEAFSEALRRPAGKGKAEIYYALATLWWERRNALAAYNWLAEGRGVREGQPWLWDPGEDGVWDRRIDGRLRYLERNFSVVKLALGSAHPLPPLAYPPPADPLLSSFVDGVGKAVEEGYAAEATNLYLMLPNGLYWVGDQEQVLNSGVLEAHKAETWELSADRGGAHKRYAEHVAEIDSMTQEKDKLRARQAEARERAAKQGHPEPSPGPVAAAEPEPTGPQRPIAHRLVTADMLESVSRDITERWRVPSFHARYVVTVPSRGSEHELDFPDAGFLLRFDEGGQLKIRGAEKLTEDLDADWIVGEAGNPNLVELWFDGRKLKVSVNGVDQRPVLVRRGEAEAPLGRWVLRLSDPKAEIQHLWIEPLVHSAGGN